MTTATVALIILIPLVIFYYVFLKKNEPSTNSPTFQVSSDEHHGKYLVDSKGRALYYFLNDEVGTPDSKPTSKCSDDCLGIWQIYFEENISVSPFLKKNDFSSITRYQDDQKQTVYKDHPLYYYVNDINPGDAKGEGVNNLWFVLKVD